jgi:hypothetical protein
MQATISRDINGNKTVKITDPGFRGFSVQTNGALRQCHQLDQGQRIDEGREEDRPYWKEIAEYVSKHGTRRQRLIFGNYLDKAAEKKGRVQTCKQLKRSAPCRWISR